MFSVITVFRTLNLKFNELLVVCFKLTHKYRLLSVVISYVTEKSSLGVRAAGFFFFRIVPE